MRNSTRSPAGRSRTSSNTSAALDFLYSCAVVGQASTCQLPSDSSPRVGPSISDREFVCQHGHHGTSRLFVQSANQRDRELERHFRLPRIADPPHYPSEADAHSSEG